VVVPWNFIRDVEALARRLATASRRPWPVEPIPIALTITDLDVGGAERALVALARGLDPRRWRPSVIALGPEGPLTRVLRDQGISTRCLDVPRGRPWEAVAQLAEALRSTSAVLAQSFLFHANVATRLAARRVGIPWVVGGLRVAERQKRWHLWLDRLTIGLSAGSVCVSQGVYEFSRREGGLPADRLIVIPNGIDPAVFDRAPAVNRETLGIPQKAHVALFVGRMDRQKGLDDLLEAATEVVRVPLPVEWHLALAGDGPLAGRLRAKATAISELAGRVHWLGRCDDVPGLLKAADLLVLPSHWEGMPNVVLEAMAAQRAVVGTAVEGTSELVVPDQTGWLVSPGSPDQLAKALKAAASEPERLRRFGDNARARVEAEFTPQKVVAAYESVWGGLLGLGESGSVQPHPSLQQDPASEAG
jgi:starch synthase (maltosyl-transferring)